MAKKTILGTLILSTFGALITHQGTLVAQTAESITLDIKRPRSSKSDRRTFNTMDVRQAWLSEEANGSYISVIGTQVDTYPDTEMTGIENGFFLGTSGDTTVIAAPGTWVFEPVVEDADDEKPAPAKSGAAKGKAKPAPAEDEDADDEKPAAKAKGKAKAEPEPADDEYTPEEGDRVVVTNEDEEEVTGVVTAITAKMITIEDEDEETHKFKLADVTVAEAPAPKAKGKPAAKGKAAAAEDEDDAEEKPAAAKGKGKPAAKGKAAADDGWDD